MSDDYQSNPPKKQLETARGGAGRKGRTAVGSGDGDDFDDFQSWPEGPGASHSGFRPRIAICDRSELIREGLKAMLESRATIVGEAADGMTAYEMVIRLRPELLILDVDLEVLNGVEVCRRTTERSPDTEILIYTDSYHATKYFNQLLRAGADGFCLKCSGPVILHQAINDLIEKIPYCDRDISKLIKQVPEFSAPPANLTDREIEVWIRLDLRNKEISEELDMKLRSVEKHIECILAKLKLPTRTAAALKAVQFGYVLLPKMPGCDPQTCKTNEQTAAENHALDAIARRRRSH